MALSQFDPTLTVSGSSVQQGPQEDRTIEVGGPLIIAERDDYLHPILVQFQVVQVKRGVKITHDNIEANIERERGVGEEVLVDGEPPDPGNPRWSGTVKLGKLVTGKADDIQKETRGVAIAVLERKLQFAFDTITWCDEVQLVEDTAAGS